MYAELRRLAHHSMRTERTSHTLQTTALVHEAYLRLADVNRMQFRDRAHFIAMAATMIRRIPVDYARAHARDTRGGGISVTSLHDAAVGPRQDVDLVALDGTLVRLGRFDPRPRYMRRERADHTLQATALIHEAYLHLIDQRDKDWQNRAHFYGVAAQVMRRILVDYARAHRTAKRGGEQHKVSLEDAILLTPEQSDELVALDEALLRLAEFDPRQTRVVELRFFGGLSEEETAQLLGVSSRTVKRDWSMAKAWLYGELNTGT